MMVLRLSLAVLLFGHCCYCLETATGLVYYPPYNDPYALESPCTAFLPWDLPEGREFQPPVMQDSTKDCRGSVNNIPFVAPKATVEPPPASVEDFVVDTKTYTEHNYRLQFTCKDSAGTVKTGLYSWEYLFRVQGILHSYSFQSMMSWDSDGKLLFQPKENKRANISCRYYDAARGYFSEVRIWRIDFSRFPAASQSSSSVEVFPCQGESTPTLSTDVQVTVTVTSNMLELGAFCPTTTCFEDTAEVFIPTAYSPPNPTCKATSYDPASYARCDLNPLKQKELSYSCSAKSDIFSNSSYVNITVQSGARFSNDEHFKPLYLREDDRDIELFCYVDPQTTKESVPTWEFLEATSTDGQYQPLASDLFRQVDDVSTGRHKLVITKVEPQHEGSYRCKVPQPPEIVPDGQPIYGYYFASVYRKPQCTPYRASAKEPLPINDNLVTYVVPDMLASHISLSCSQAEVTKCPNGAVCEPVALLRRDSTLCSMSNTSSNSCGDMQDIQTSVNSDGSLSVGVIINNPEILELTKFNEEDLQGVYSVEFVYPAPALLSFELPFNITVKFNRTKPSVELPDGKLPDSELPDDNPANVTKQPVLSASDDKSKFPWWIVLLVGLIILILLVTVIIVLVCKRKSRQRYALDGTDGSAGKELAGRSSQPNKGKSQPLLPKSGNAAEDNL